MPPFLLRRLRRAPRPPMPVVVGVPRSGTTLLRLMLDSHPRLAIPPETGFLVLATHLGGSDDDARERFFDAVTHYPRDAPAWLDFDIPADDFRAALEALRPFSAADGFRVFYRLYAQRHGKPRWGDKTPNYARHLRDIATTLPEARFVHLLRDGRDVAVSLRPLWFAPGRGIETLARAWRDTILAARQQARAGDHYLEVRFEELVAEPRSVLARVCAAIDLEPSDEMLDYPRRTPQRLAEHLERRGVDGTLVASRAQRLAQQAKTFEPPDPSRVGAWRETLTATEVRTFEEVAGELLVELGYPLCGGRGG